MPVFIALLMAFIGPSSIDRTWAMADASTLGVIDGSIYVDANTPKAKRLGVEERKATYAIWDRLAECESGGDWSINTHNGFYGGLQFSLTSWRNVGGSGYPHQNSREEQIYRGEKLKALQGWGAWPACSRKLGLR